MKVIYNRVIPFRGFVAINLFGAVFARKEFRPLKPYVLRHEAIHTAQIRETGYVFFYVLYLLEWLLKSVQRMTGFPSNARPACTKPLRIT